MVGESPRWHEDRLWFAHWGTGDIIATNLDGERETVAHVNTTIPFSIDWLPDGRLLVVSGREQVLLRSEPHGSFVPHATLGSEKGYIFNEIVVDGHGNVYVNGGMFDPPGAKPSGVIVHVTAAGTVRKVANALSFPNGMAVTQDNSTLIVAESYATRLTAFDIDDDGGLSKRRVWADLKGDNPDGICVDAENTVWYASVPRKHCVRVREGGEVLQTIPLDRGCFACMLGGPDRRSLFMLEAEFRGFEHMFDGPRTGRVVSAQAPSPGAGWP
jgi:sugar lactone lactonase YvrE